MNALFSVPFAGTAVLLAATIAVTASAAKRIAEPIGIPLSEIPRTLSGWEAVGDSTLTAGVLKQLAPTDYLSRRYTKAGSQVDLFVAYYAQQRAGESMHSPKHCLPGAGWEIWKHDTTAIPVNGTTVRVNKYHIHNSGARMVMYYWYQSRERIVASEYTAKVMLARDTLLTGRTSGSIVRIVLPDTDAAAAEAPALAARIIAEVQRCFDKPARGDL